MDKPLPQGVTLIQGQGGLPCLQIDSNLCTAQLYLQGAHLAHWQPQSQTKPVLWMSGSGWFAPGKPIRGGVPLCFPWFGPHPSDSNLPGHGFARLFPWTLHDVRRDSQDRITVELTLTPHAQIQQLFSQDFALHYTLRLGSELDLSLTIHNQSQTALTFEEALHTYFTVGDVRQVQITGLAGATYIDKTDAMKRKVEGDVPITITGETDRLYLHTSAAMTLQDPLLQRQLIVSKTGSQSSVVWNPWINKSKAMPDFGDEEWPGMICLETVNAADNKLTLPTGAKHTMTTTVAVEPLG